MQCVGVMWHCVGSIVVVQAKYVLFIPVLTDIRGLNGGFRPCFVTGVKGGFYGVSDGF